jgi:tetratricopeptide (TPR) repeat protein
MTRLKIAVFLLLLIIPGILVSIWISQEVIKIRMLEMEYRLEDESREHSSEDYISILMKFKIQQKLMSETLDEASLLDEEVKRSAVYQFPDFNADTTLPFQTRVIGQGINLFRKLSGKKPIVLKSRRNLLLAIYQGYYHERNKRYEMALDSYRKGLENEKTYTLDRGLLLMHSAFCLALTGRTDESIRYCQEIITHYPDEKISASAFLLIEFIQSFEEEKKSVQKIETLSLETSRKLYMTVAYDEALKILNEMETSGSPDSKKIDFSYYKGRCFEEIGKRNQAVKEYQSIIIRQPDHDFSKLSNKRIYFIGKNDQNKELEDLARINNRVIRDPDFDRFVADSSHLIQDLTVDQSIKDEFRREDKDQAELTALIRDSQEKLKEKISPDKSRDQKVTLVQETKTYHDEFVDEKNDRGLVIKSTYYNDKGEMEYYSLFEYNDKDQVIVIRQFDPSGTLQLYYVYSYDASGKPKQILQYDANGKLMSR